ncbi:o-succinylbenzoate synthase [Apibacter mensalis]|uniref:o-succinylbenzoate synthase n=1 Tax=Apibacter mensalis TaxID=1586267 RepID=UPI00350E36F1
MIQANFTSYELQFKRPAGTSRGTLNSKLTYLLKVQNSDTEYVGECSFFRGLSADSETEYEPKLQWVCDHINEGKEFLLTNCQEFPSIQFGIEQIFAQIESRKNGMFFPSEFTEGKQGIKINGLIWMGNLDFMREQIQQKLKQNYSCIKLKIGVNWQEEYKILQNLRKEFSASQLELRVDANGGFSFEEAKKVLEQLAQLEIHSIEQPIKAGNENQMAELCKYTPTPIALDEELIGKFYKDQKEKTLEIIKPQYIILKPSLIGGWKGSEEWIEIAESKNIDWWITSALESNIGLNAIAQWTALFHKDMPQGLGTGSLYTNNFPSKLSVRGEYLFYNP